MFKLIKDIEVYDPIYQGVQDILICGDKIVKIEPNINYADALVIDKKGFKAIPGIIDQHIHITGGGGEGGFHTRTPEVSFIDLIKGGVTTVVGMLGTDSLTQGIETLVAKTKALKTEGVTAYCLTGAYHFPSPTLTGDLRKDIAFIDEIIGVKLALSDHREPLINQDELKKLASIVRVSSMIASKPGIITVHMGNDKKGLQPIFDILSETSLPINHFRPTHVNRNERLFSDALKFLSLGGYIDITVGSSFERLKSDLTKIDEQDLHHVTFSSDGNGSRSKYDASGKLVKIGVQGCDGILKTIKYLVNNDVSIEKSIKFATSNVSDALDLTNKGYLKENKDADILIIDDNFDLDSVISLGRVMMLDKELRVKGMYER
ncbi:beta-aspartyl-peptidase [Mycoplasmatota bacterium]|nr:beta-aspartyl-peptidase [Mycoplasmatota bacterium]